MMDMLRFGFHSKKGHSKKSIALDKRGIILEDFAEWLLVGVFIVFGLILLFAITSLHQKNVKQKFEDLEKQIYTSQVINMELKRTITYSNKELTVAEALGLLGDLRYKGYKKRAKQLAGIISKKLSFGEYNAVICFSDYSEKNCYGYIEGMELYTKLLIPGMLNTYDMIIGFANPYKNIAKNIVYKY